MYYPCMFPHPVYQAQRWPHQRPAMKIHIRAKNCTSKIDEIELTGNGMLMVAHPKPKFDGLFSSKSLHMKQLASK